MKFSELVRKLEKGGFKVIRQKGSIRFYSKPNHSRLVRLDYYGSKKSRKEPAVLF